MANIGMKTKQRLRRLYLNAQAYLDELEKKEKEIMQRVDNKIDDLKVQELKNEINNS